MTCFGKPSADTQTNKITKQMCTIFWKRDIKVVDVNQDHHNIGTKHKPLIDRLVSRYSVSFLTFCDFPCSECSTYNLQSSSVKPSISTKMVALF